VAPLTFGAELGAFSSSTSTCFYLTIIKAVSMLRLEAARDPPFRHRLQNL